MNTQEIVVTLRLTGSQASNGSPPRSARIEGDTYFNFQLIRSLSAPQIYLARNWLLSHFANDSVSAPEDGVVPSFGIREAFPIILIYCYVNF
jgi:hypothetical protein